MAVTVHTPAEGRTDRDADAAVGASTRGRNGVGPSTSTALRAQGQRNRNNGPGAPKDFACTAGVAVGARFEVQTHIHRERAAPGSTRSQEGR